MKKEAYVNPRKFESIKSLRLILMDFFLKNTRLFLILFLLTIAIFWLKLFWVPIYWPGGDYLNHLQNAYHLLGRSHSSFEQYQANAWWQPIGPALYLIIIGTPFFKSFYPFIIMQSCSF